jgi:hypothetical protein
MFSINICNLIWRNSPPPPPDNQALCCSSGRMIVQALQPFQRARIKQRRFLNACRCDGAVSTVSTRALMVLYAILESLARVRNQSPPQIVQGSLLGLWVESNRKHVLSRSDVPTDRQIPLWWYRDMIPASKFIF